MTSNIDIIEPAHSGLLKSRPGIVFMVVSVTFLTALLVPLPQKALDVLWVCSFCFTAAATFVCIAAKTISDLMGFVPLLSGLSLLRLIAQAATSRRIIQQEPPGFLLDLTGSAIASSWPIGTVLICLLLAVIIGIIVFSAGRTITLASVGYVRKVLPLKLSGIETDLRLGVIDTRQADLLSQRIKTESRFFSGLHQTGILMRTEVSMCICLVIGCLLIRVANNAYQISNAAIVSDIAGPVVGLCVFTLIPVLFVAASCRALMGRDTLFLYKVDRENGASAHAKKITVVELDTTAQPNVKESVPDPQQTSLSSSSIHSVPEPQVMNCRNANEYYEKLSQVTCTVEAHPRAILLASEQIYVLPVTVPINIAIRLSQKGQKILLVDTDDERNALAGVFDMDPEKLRKKVLPSSLENLSICCVPVRKISSFLHKTKILEHFDTTMIYAPRIPVVSQSDPIVRPGTFYFVERQNSAIKKEVKKSLEFCRWVCLIPSIQSVLETKT